MNYKLFLGALVGIVVVVGFNHFRSGQSSVLGAAQINRITSFDTSSRVFVLTSSTQVAATNSARTYLEISNISGATTTGQTVYCHAKDGAAATTYSGFPVFSSSTKIFNLDNNYTGAVNCISVGATTAGVTVLEK